MDGALAEAEAGGYRSRRLRLGNDLRVSGYSASSFVTWLFGRPDDALARADRAVALARELDHPYSIAYALFHNGLLRHWRREPERVRDRALDVLAVAEANDLPIWRALGHVLLGAASSALGDPATGRREVADGLDQYQGLRTPPVFWPMVRYLEAGVLLEAGEPARAIPLVDEAIALTPPDDMLAPLYGILKGDLLRGLQPPDMDGARELYAGAFELATRIRTPGTELRAAARRLDVARPDERDERAAELRAVLDTFTEGRTLADVLDAETLLGR